jgi:glucoamylase
MLLATAPPTRCASEVFVPAGSDDAPGWPGIPARWTSSAKSGVGTSLTAASRVWFTIGYGILNEIYYPDVDTACTRDMGLIVTDGQGFLSEEKRHASHELAFAREGAPSFRLTNTCTQGRYRIEKEIITDPARHAVLQRTRFTPLLGRMDDYHLHVLAAPHLGNRGAGNTAWVGEHKGVPMLFARRHGYALALASSAPWLGRSVGFVGTSDGWKDLTIHQQMEWSYQRAENGNVALCGEVDLRGCGGAFVLSLGFGTTPAEAGHHALASLQGGFDEAQAAYLERWLAWQRSLLALQPPEAGGRDLYRISTAVLGTHEAEDYLGGAIASLSIPWGSSKGDEDLGGYHLVWPRDLVETAGALLAAGAQADARRVLAYLEATQEADGHWAQNMWLDGTPYWKGVQMDETAFPVLLVDLARREGALGADAVARFWPMIRRAAGYLVRSGPVTPQDRWEEDPGYSPFTLAVEIAGLLAAADLAELSGDGTSAAYLRETADCWNASIERWIYVSDTVLARQAGVEGHYVRIAPPETEDGTTPPEARVPIKNRPLESSTAPAAHLVSPDALALVRFGLRAPDDPCVLDTVRVIDAVLRVDTPAGPLWRRYNGDGYGEHEDGSPFDGTGLGRAWPLLTGERAHFELAAGRRDEAVRLLRSLGAFANEGGLLPEQIWDAPDVPERELFFGRPSGSAMPLVWAHAEYIKLLRSLRDGRVFDMPPQTVDRYVRRKVGSKLQPWRFNHKCRTMPATMTLRIETLAPAAIRWSSDGWRTMRDAVTRDTGLGVHLLDLPTGDLPAGRAVVFTFRWLQVDRWEGRDFTVEVQ